MDLSQDFDDSCYGLGENPKKTWRVSFSDKKQSIHHKENTRHHCCKKSWVSPQCENTITGFEVLCPIKKKRSKLRYKASGFCSVSNFNSISKFSEFGREEDAALSLVMLSSGFTKWADFISDFDSSENDSLILKAKAFNGNKMEINVDSEATGVELENKIGLELAQCDSKIKFGEISFGDQDTELGANLVSCDSQFRDFVGKENCDFVSEISEKSKNKPEFECKGFEQKNERPICFKVDFVSDCGSSEKDYLISKASVFNGNKMELNVESENTGVKLGNTNGLEIKFGETEFCDQETELGTKLIYCDPKIGDFVSWNTFKKPVIDDTLEISFSENRKGNNFRTSEETSFNDQNIELRINGFVGMEIDDYVSKISEICETKTEFKCKSCSKKFLSFQALGGHRAKKCDEKSNEMEKSHGRKKSKGVHSCPICFKVFPSGQALGGHKRAHFNGFSEIKNKVSAASVAGFSFEKQFGSGFGLIPCGAKSDCELAPVVISN